MPILPPYSSRGSPPATWNRFGRLRWVFKAWCPVPSVQEQKSMARLEEEEHQQKQRLAQPKLIGEQVLEIALATEARGERCHVFSIPELPDL